MRLITSLIFFLLIGATPSLAHAATNLNVPFTSQAPEGNWQEPWQNACEEATIAIVDAYYQQKQFTSASAKSAILHAFSIKNNIFGWSLDEDAYRMQQLINKFYTWEVHAVEDPTIEMIKAQINAGRPVIALASGKKLGNSLFRTNPQYHTYVISGYDDATSEFIVQEPGTQYGANHRYAYSTVIDAMHDFLPGDTENGKKIALFTRPSSSDLSLETDGDGDGLSKRLELAYGSILWLVDSDGDGYDDGTEVRHGFLPTKNELKDLEGALIKSYNNPKVYRVESNKKRHIISPFVFLSHGWKWEDIQIVSTALISYLQTGTLILY